jgi:4-amino-4-deoxy-L-arabinose transferase-like glycosyltransferase
VTAVDTAAPPESRSTAGRSSRVRAAFRRVPGGIWLPTLVAILNAMVWAVVTPTFQVPDEPGHIGYVQYLAETGDVPRPTNPAAGDVSALSDEVEQAFSRVPFSHTGLPTWDEDDSRNAHQALEQDLNRVSEGGAGAAANNPPLYYAVEALPYLAFSKAEFFDRLLAMRLFSALFAGAIAAFTFMFLREVMPRTPWAWSVGALMVAFQPLMGNVTGGVNPDALLWAACAALFWLLARAFRRGLSVPIGVGLGAALAVGLLTKGAMLGLVPGLAVGLIALVWRAPPERRRATLAAAAVAVAVAAVPYLSWVVASTNVFDRNPAATTGGVDALGGGVDYAEEASYIWQVYLPRLPFMDDQFAEYPLYDSYFTGFVGRFGFNEFGFGDTTYKAALLFALGLIALAGAFLARSWGRLRESRRRGELLSYATMVVGLMALLGVAGYQFRERNGLGFEQARYVLLLLPLYGLLVAMAARALGRQWGPALGVALVVLACLHQVLAVLLTLGRYYA